jgi:hypothetical protein
VNYIGITNNFPAQVLGSARTVIGKTHQDYKGVFFNMHEWNTFTSKVMIDWIDDAVVCLQDGKSGALPPSPVAAYVIIPGVEVRARITARKWVCVRLHCNEIYVGVRKFYLTDRACTIDPGKGINLTLYEWSILLSHVKDVSPVLCYK